MSNEDKEIDGKIFDETTAELVDLNTSQETESDIQILDEVDEVDKNDNVVKDGETKESGASASAKHDEEIEVRLYMPW